MPLTSKPVVRAFSFTIALLSLAAVTSPIAAADTISTFHLAATVPDGTVTGNLQIDTTTGQPGYGDFIVSLGGFGSLPLVRYETAGLFGPAAPLDRLNYPDSVYFNLMAPDGVNLQAPVTTLVGYTGGNLCPAAGFSPGNCFGPGEGSGVITTGLPYFGNTLEIFGAHTPLTLVSTTVTPEPSTFVLLGTGLLGAFGAAKRRFAKR